MDLKNLSSDQPCRVGGFSLVAALMFAVFSIASSGGSILINSKGQETYGVDVSWPIHHNETGSNLMGNKMKEYESFIDSCYDAVNDKQKVRGARRKNVQCSTGENDRIRMDLLQPRSVRNYTETGFKKIRAPEAMFAKIKKFYDKNRDQEVTEWHNINTYHNMWESPPTIINIQNSSLDGGGGNIIIELWDAARDVLEDWIGQALVGCSVWGIRLYHEGAILAPHIDRMPLVISAIINVDQDVDEPWPLEVYGRDGMAYNITMEPGDMVLYESHSTLHGRPFPLKGNFFSNIFLHFEPVGPLSPDGSFHKDNLDNQEKESIGAGLPPYLIKSSPWEEMYREHNPDGWQLSTSPQIAAQGNDINAMRAHTVVSGTKIHEKDENGWQPIHEAACRGYVEIIKLLLENGANVNEVTNYGEGSTPLALARKDLNENHPIIAYLLSVGGTENRDQPQMSLSESESDDEEL